MSKWNAELNARGDVLARVLAELVVRSGGPEAEYREALARAERTLDWLAPGLLAELRGKTDADV